MARFLTTTNNRRLFVALQNAKKKRLARAISQHGGALGDPAGPFNVVNGGDNVVNGGDNVITL